MKKTIETRANKFVYECRDAAINNVTPGDIPQLLWFMRHAFRMGWNAAKQDAYAKRRKEGK